MKFLPALDFMRLRSEHAVVAISVNRGQWVTQGQGKGRIVALGKKLQVLWRMRKESFRSYVLRFKVAIAKLIPVRRSPSCPSAQLPFNFESGPFTPRVNAMSFLLDKVNSAGTKTRESRIYGSLLLRHEPRQINRFWGPRHTTAQQLEQFKAQFPNTFYNCHG